MSTTTIDPTSDASVVSAADRVRSELERLTARLRRDVRLHGSLAVTATAGGTLLAMIILDAILQPESTVLRLLLWLSVFASGVVAICRFIWVPLRARCHSSALAWSLEQEHPELQERLTSTLLLADSRQPASGALIDKVAAQAHRKLADCRDDSAIRQDILRPGLAAAGCLVMAAFCFAVWPQYLVPSLLNVMAPWHARQLPYLTADISPGHVAVAEGEAVEVSAIGDHLHDSVLEIMDGTTVLSSMPMTVSAAGNEADVLLTGLTADQVYRVRSGSLVSDVYRITVHPRPVVKDVRARLQFPEYSGLPPETIDDFSEPITAIPGTQVRFTVATGIPISDTKFTFGGKRQGVAEVVQTDDASLHHWSLHVDAEPVQAGRLELFSDHGVPSEPFSFEVRSVLDKPPTISITTPALQYPAVRPDDRLLIRFEAADDFGLDSVEVRIQAEGREPQRHPVLKDPAALNLTAEYILRPQESGLDVGDQLMVWLVAADNRTQEYGVAQITESRRLMIRVSDDAVSVGSQQVIDEQNRLLESLSDAIELLSEAQETAQEISDAAQQDGVDGQNSDEIIPADTNADAQQLQRQLQDARDVLEDIAERNETATALFDPERQRVRDITDEDIEEAQRQAQVIPLASDPTEQQQSADAAGSAAEQAEVRLTELKEQLRNRAEQLLQAAELDELARKQNELARRMENRKHAVQEPDAQQEQIASRLQELVSRDPEAESEQFRQRADKAEQLAERSKQLREQQQRLADAVESASDEETRRRLAEAIRAEQEALAAENQQPKRATQQNTEIPPNEESAPQDQELPEQPTNEIAERRLQAAEQNANEARGKLQEVSARRDADADGGANRRPPDSAQDPSQPARRQERIEEAMRAVEEDDFETAADELQELITDRLEQVAAEAEELLELPSDDEANRNAGNEAQLRMREALSDSRKASARPPKPTSGNAPDSRPQQQDRRQDKNTEEPQTQQAVDQRPGDQRPGDQQPGEQQPGEQQPGEQQPGEQQQGEQQQSEQQQGQQQPAEQQQAEQQPARQEIGPPAKKDEADRPTPGTQRSADAEEKRTAEQNQRETPPSQQKPKSGDPRTPQQQTSTKQQNNKASQSLKEATESLRQFCESCRQCAECNKPGRSGSASGNASRPGNKQPGNQQPGNQQPGNQQPSNQQAGNKQPGEQPAPGEPAAGKQSGEKQPGPGGQQNPGPSKQLARTTDNARKAARRPTPGAAKQLARELDELADEAAQSSNYPQRGSKPQAPDRKSNSGRQRQTDTDNTNGRPESGGPQSDAPMGVGPDSRPDDTVTPATQLRGPSTSDWTRSRKRLQGSVLDSRRTRIPEAYRGVVEDYFEQLSRLEKDRSEPEVFE